MNDMEAYGDGYMEPEEEWEREGLLDPAWEKQQKKVKNKPTKMTTTTENEISEAKILKDHIKSFGNIVN